MLHISYEELLRLAVSYQYSGIFHADIMINGQPGFVEVLIQDGQSFDILSVPAPRRGESWETMLAPLGRLYWKLIAPETSNIAARNEYHAQLLQVNQVTQQQQAQARAQEAQHRYQAIPRQKIQLSPDQLRQLPHRYRTVYMLIDGYRTPKDIATILNKTIEETDQALAYLHQQNIIT
ncbi:hypothetical protein [Dictyobacter aurantiacus]|uniref:Uncharacterized protein n=1 Tax=Dictyobacter aurantiacus TaxID=1936993 RepID=A0A401ZL16_9CHLR|nr:hypothetical protein [Dictyobacter aurantiacus]GCE07518.1 hypothetical protein KDAU_48470 [Dictyobacter aurantiacus]